MNTSPLRRTLAAVTALAASAALLTACGSGSAGDSKADKTIAFDYPYTSLPIYTVTLKAAKDQAEKRGYEIITTEDEGSLDKQVANITTLLNKGVGAITTFPIEPSALAGLVKTAQDKGVPWVVYGGSMEGMDANIDFSGEESGTVIAKAYADWLTANGKDTGTVLVLGNSTIELGRTRTTGMLDGLKQYAPNVTIVREDALGTDEGLSATKAKLASNPKITAVLAVNDDTAVGAAKAFEEAGRDVATSFVGGNDGGPVALKAIESGTSVLKATVTIDPTAVGRAVADVSADLIEGKKTDGFVVKPTPVTIDTSDLGALIAAFN